jgi:prolyl oligopeptidase PreP (S9A serine peptidase family)
VGVTNPPISAIAAPTSLAGGKIVEHIKPVLIQVSTGGSDVDVMIEVDVDVGIKLEDVEVLTSQPVVGM